MSSLFEQEFSFEKEREMIEKHVAARFAEADKQKAEADRTKAEADRTKAEADRTKAEALNLVRKSVIMLKKAGMNFEDIAKEVGTEFSYSVIKEIYDEN